MAVRADEADSQIVTSVIIVKQRCAPPQFHPPSRIVHLPLDPAVSAASPQRAAASSVEGNRREGRGGKKGGAAGREEERRRTSDSPSSIITVSTKTWDVVPDAKIHVSVYALKPRPSPSSSCPPTAARREADQGHREESVDADLQEVSLARALARALARPFR
jgi:hypothetical protein